MKKKNKHVLPEVRADFRIASGNTPGGEDDLEFTHTLVLKAHCPGVRSVNVTSDNRYLIITFEDNESIRVIDLLKLEYIPHTYPGHTDSVRLTSITRDNRAFFTASWDGSYRKYDIATGECTSTINGLGRSPSCFLDPEQKYLFTASYDSDYDLESNNTGRCWDLSSGETVNLYRHTEDRMRHEAMDIAYDEGEVYTGSDDGRAYRWKLTAKVPSIDFFSFDGTVRKLAVSKHYLAAACTDGTVRIHNKKTGERFRYIAHSEMDIREVRISEDETKLWSASGEGSVFCYKLLSGEKVYTRKLNYLWIWSLSLMNEEKILVAGSGDGSVTFLDASNGQTIATIYILPDSKDFLITCPPDKVFKKGIFYTTDTKMLRVYMESRKDNTRVKLDVNDPRRQSYIDRHNLKNLIISKLKNDGRYNSLTAHYSQNKIMLDKAHGYSGPRMLKA